MTEDSKQVHICGVSSWGIEVKDEFFNDHVLPAYYASKIEPFVYDNPSGLADRLSRCSERSIQQLDLWGHGQPGVLELGRKHRLSASPSDYSVLEEARYKFAKGACIRLCGCNVGSFVSLGRSGPALVVELANVLGVKVKATRDDLLAWCFPSTIDGMEAYFQWAVAEVPWDEEFMEEIVVNLQEGGCPEDKSIDSSELIEYLSGFASVRLEGETDDWGGWDDFRGSLDIQRTQLGYGLSLGTRIFDVNNRPIGKLVLQQTKLILEGDIQGVDKPKGTSVVVPRKRE